MSGAWTPRKEDSTPVRRAVMAAGRETRRLPAVKLDRRMDGWEHACLGSVQEGKELGMEDGSTAGALLFRLLYGIGRAHRRSSS